MRSSSFHLFVGLIASTWLGAAQLTPEQAIKVRSISQLSFSPDGKHLVFEVSEPLKGTTPQAHLWMLDVMREEARQFTFSSKTERSAEWSPDGKTLAFLSDRNERMQIYVMPLDGGEAQALTSGKNAVSSFRWRPDGRAIAFLAPEPKPEAEEKKEKDQDDGQVADRESELARLWLSDLDSKKVTQISRGTWQIEEFEWLSPTRLLASAKEHPREETWDGGLYSIDAVSGAYTLFARPNEPFGGLSVSKDRTRVAYSASRDHGPTPHDLFVQAAAGGNAEDVTRSIDRMVLGVKWLSGDSAILSVADGFRSRLYRMSGGQQPKPIELPFSNGDFDGAADGTVAFIAQGFNRLPELYLGGSRKPAKQITHLQTGWRDITLAGAETFTFSSFDGTTVQAALMKPKERPSGGKLPLVVFVHGGPAGFFNASYSSWAQLLAARGYEVLMVNPRGSIGYGEKFLKANRADWGGGDFKDIMAGLESVLARGETDPNRLGIGGWSYGGYMAEWAITQTQRFKAAVSGAGMFDLAAEFGTEVGPEYDEWYFGTPWEHADAFAHSSPMTYIRNAKTPTLILQGENDPVDPLGQSASLYRALKRYGVPTELVVFPREPHGPREEKHQIDLLTRMLDWFDRYLKQTGA